MDSMQINKAISAFLIVGIVFFLTGTLGDFLVHTPKLEHSALKIEAAAPTAAGPAAKEEELAPISPLLAAADPGAGEALMKKQCSACHTFTDGGKNGVGPNLYGVLGRQTASETGFNYSDALKKKTVPWTYEELNAWLHKPASYAPGTRMAFAGIKSDKQRADVIAYLRSLSKSPEKLP